MQKIFVTGGAGYIGSHTVLSLLQNNYQVTVFDNLECGTMDALENVRALAEKDENSLKFIKGDIRNSQDLDKALATDKFDAVIHFAAYKNISESMEKPDKYYENNVVGSLTLLKSMLKSGVNNIIFSSSCAVHGQVENPPVKEIDELKPLSPYARTKLAVEYMLEDFNSLGINSVRLRYFSAAGAHPSGRIGENPKVLLNIIPRLFGTALGKYTLKIFGNKFDTPDGYQIRDYIHVVDLANGHVKALKFLETHKGSYVFGLGTEKGTSVLQLIKEIEKLTGKEIKFEVTEPKSGDPIIVYGDSSKANTILGWKAQYEYKEMLAHAWNWYKNNLDEF